MGRGGEKVPEREREERESQTLGDHTWAETNGDAGEMERQRWRHIDRHTGRRNRGFGGRWRQSGRRRLKVSDVLKKSLHLG